MKVANKKPPKFKDPELSRVLDKIYTDINEIIKSVNNYEGTFEEWKGKQGDVRVTQDGLQYRDKTGWKTIALASHSHTASEVSTDTSGFDDEIGSSDNTVQKALDTLNDHEH